MLHIITNNADIIFNISSVFFKRFYTFKGVNVQRCKTICELLFFIPMYPKKPIDNTHIYNVYIQNNVLYTHRPNKITKILKNQIEYKIYSDVYSKDTPILHVSIYDDHHIKIQLTKLYEGIYTKNDKMDYILRILQDSYNEYIATNNVNLRNIYLEGPTGSQGATGSDVK